MKQVRIIGLMLLALLALGSFAASAASAEEGVLPPSNFTGESKETSTLETLNKEKISCTALSILEGKFLVAPEPNPDQHGLANLHFSGCKAEGLLSANTLGDEPGIILVKVLFLICLVEPVKLVFGVLILPEETVHIEVPFKSELVLVKGAVIAELEGLGLKGKDFKFRLVGKEGDQTVALKCEINGKKFEHTLVGANDSEKKVDVMASENAKFLILFEKEVELMDT
jgi:hypothetical protein